MSQRNYVLGWVQNSQTGRSTLVGYVPDTTPIEQWTQYNTIQYNTKFVKRHVAVASEALANRTVRKHRRKRMVI